MSPRSFAAPVAALLSCALLAASTATPALAADPVPLGTYHDWKALTYDEAGKKICYVVSFPKKDEGNYQHRGDAYVTVTHRPTERSFGVVSIVAGYTYQNDSDVTLTIGNQTFHLFTDADTAWARDDATDRQIVKAMRAAMKMVIKGTSNRGTQTTDTYSLSGVSAALVSIDHACNVKR